MRAYDLILKKRNGAELSTEEINYLIQGYTRGTIPNYQMSAWAMAVWFKGMSSQETADLTLAMVNSGEQVDLQAIKGIKVDKHSTGGVGDKTTMVLIPLVAAVGVPVAKMSGRGLGHTGGTLDKFESIPGFRVDLSTQEFYANVNEVGAAVIGQTANLTPADKKLYALRDVTATVDSIPLIASSVMSKKIAAGADAIILDVKVGSGAFMKDAEPAFELARAMVKIGQVVGRRTVAVVTDMDQPLGLAVGNALEVREAIETLQGRGPADLTELCLVLGSWMMRLAGLDAGEAETRAKLRQALQDGAGLAKLRELVAAQGGTPAVVDNPELLPHAKYVVEVRAGKAGFVGRIEAEAVGRGAAILGAGREKKEDPVNPAAGIVLNKKVGDRVQTREVLAWLHTDDESKVKVVSTLILQAYTISSQLPEQRLLVFGVIDK